jgi:hypothetical protein
MPHQADLRLDAATADNSGTPAAYSQNEAASNRWYVFARLQVAEVFGWLVLVGGVGRNRLQAAKT